MGLLTLDAGTTSLYLLEDYSFLLIVDFCVEHGDSYICCGSSFRKDICVEDNTELFLSGGGRFSNGVCGIPLFHSPAISPAAQISHAQAPSTWRPAP